ncbi:thiamine pyrophosphate-dependent dehydrogenase E1 component subunit alpha [Bacillus velezensis]
MTTNRHQALGLSDEEAVEMYRTMLLARKIDERMWLLNRSGKIPFVVSCQGQEAAQVGAAYALNRDTDYVLPYYRDMGVVLAFGMTAKDLMMSGFAKAADPNSGGRQMPGHFGQKENRIVTGSSPVTTQVPHAVGIALAGRMDKKDIVSFVTFGEGSSNQGIFTKGQTLPPCINCLVIFMCENNKYAISVPYDKQVACENISDRAAGYGMPGVTVDGNDLLEVYRAVKEARERASKGEGPTLIETVSYRLTPHSSDDDDSSYREREEVEEAKKQDPLLLYKAYLQEAGLLGEEEEKTMLDDIMAIVNEATDEAEKAPYASPESTLDHVYAK